MRILIFPFSRNLGDKENPKNYPYWPELIRLLQEAGHDITQVGFGDEAKLVPSYIFYGNANDENNFSNLYHATVYGSVYDFYISVDNFAHHFYHHYNIKGVVIFGQSSPWLFSYEENLSIIKGIEYLRPNQFATWHEAEYNPDAFTSAQDVFDTIQNTFIPSLK